MCLSYQRPRVPIFSPLISHYDYLFKCTESPQNDIEPYKVKCTHIHVSLVFSSPKFLPVSLHDQPFSSYRPFLRQVHRITQNDLEPYEVKYIYICVTSFPQISVRFALQPAIFEIQRC